MLVEFDASQPMAHTAGPDLDVATVAVDFWNWLSAYAARRNEGRDKTFDQFSPSLRQLHTSTDEQMHDHVVAQAGIRLPLDFNGDIFVDALITWAEERAGVEVGSIVRPGVVTEQDIIHRHRRRPHDDPAAAAGARACLSQRPQQCPGACVSRRSAQRGRRCQAWFPGQERHQRHERGGAGLELSDRGLWAGRQQPGPHAATSMCRWTSIGAPCWCWSRRCGTWRAQNRLARRWIFQGDRLRAQAVAEVAVGGALHDGLRARELYSRIKAFDQRAVAVAGEDCP